MVSNTLLCATTWRFVIVVSWVDPWMGLKLLHEVSVTEVRVAQPAVWQAINSAASRFRFLRIEVSGAFDLGPLFHAAGTFVMKLNPQPGPANGKA